MVGSLIAHGQIDSRMKVRGFVSGGKYGSIGDGSNAIGSTIKVRGVVSGRHLAQAAQHEPGR
jgi:hypothetical protein